MSSQNSKRDIALKDNKIIINLNFYEVVFLKTLGKILWFHDNNWDWEKEEHPWVFYRKGYFSKSNTKNIDVIVRSLKKQGLFKSRSIKEALLKDKFDDIKALWDYFQSKKSYNFVL